MLPDRDVLLVALEAARLGTVPLLLIAFSFVFYRQVTTDNSHSAITQVVVKVVKPRYAAILALGTIVAATYFADGVVLIGTAVLRHVWEGYTPQWHRLEYADVAGLTAFALLLAIGSYKESKDIAVWTRRGVKFFVFLAILIDSAQLALIALTASFLPPPSRGASSNVFYTCRSADPAWRDQTNPTFQSCLRSQTCTCQTSFISRLSQHDFYSSFRSSSFS